MKAKQNYPIMAEHKSNGEIVLFTGVSEGMCVWSVDEKMLGEYSYDWDMDEFRKYRLGEITIKANTEGEIR